MAAVVFVLLLLNANRVERRSPEPPAAGAATRPAPTAPPKTPATPAPTPSPTPAPTPPLETSRFVVPVEATPEPTATPTPEPTPTPPAPPATSCVEATWRAFDSPAVLGEVLVEITATSHCGRDLEPLEVWFRVSTFQNGALIHTREGHPFDPLHRDRQVKATIVVPGAVSLYDHIDVEVTAPTKQSTRSRP